MSSDPHAAARRGALAASLGFLLWGLVPIYWKQLHAVSAFELIAHRIVWSLLFLLAVMAWQKSLPGLKAVFTDRRVFVGSLVSGLLLAGNWTVYVWGVNAGHVIETSLGYFLSPLGNVALGFLVLHERLRPLQWMAIVMAVLGVVVLLVGAGHVPWIALTLAGTWSLYGIFKKKSPLGSIPGLTAETMLLFPLATAFLIWQAHTGAGALGRVDAGLHALILCAGIVTTIPLLLFAYGARRLQLTTLGVLQYLSPTVQFLLGLFLYREPFDAVRLQACALIWAGLLIYSADIFRRRAPAVVPPAD